MPMPKWSSSGGASFLAAPALIKPEVPSSGLPDFSRRRHAQCAAIDRSQQVQTEVVHRVGIERPALRDSVSTLTQTMQIVA